MGIALSVSGLRRWLNNAVEFNSALKLRFQRRDADAIACLERIYASHADTGPSSRAPIQLNVVYAGLRLNTGAKRDAYDACAIAIAQIRNIDFARSRYRRADATYLLYACKYIVASTTEYVDSEAFKLAASIQLTYRDINLARTRRSVRDAYSMTPSWGAEFDTWFLQNALVAEAANAPGSSS